MRLGISFGIGKRLRVGGTIGTNGRPRLWARERIGKRTYISESTSTGRKRRTR